MISSRPSDPQGSGFRVKGLGIQSFGFGSGFLTMRRPLLELACWNPKPQTLNADARDHRAMHKPHCLSFLEDSFWFRV